jgi:metallo-beta-lactamase class B
MKSNKKVNYCSPLKHYSRSLLIFTISLLSLGCTTQKTLISYETKNLRIQQLTEHTFMHTSYLNTDSFGKVPCNGMIVMDKGEAIVFDTPVNDADSEDLIDYLEEILNSQVKGVIVTHFHKDCLGGLRIFHDRNITSYANQRTIGLARAKGELLPQNAFDTSLKLNVGSKKVLAEFIGEGHTRDNIIGFFPDEKVMFGGCLIKSNGAGKGNLEDANIAAWSQTVTHLKNKYPKSSVIIPGHGTPGGIELLDYTIALFANSEK